MTTRTRRALVTLLALATLLVGVACTRPATQSASSATDLVRISVGVDASYAPFYVADKEGMFADAGLDVNIIQTEGGAASAQNVVAGASEMSGNADATALLTMAANPSLRALGVYEDSDRYFQVVLRPGVEPGAITKMGVFPGVGMYFTDLYLRSIGVDPATVEFVNTSPPEHPVLLERGDIDGFVSFDPWAAQAVAAGARVVATSGDFDARYSQWLIASASWLDANEELAARVFAVVADAAQIVRTDPDRAAAAISASIAVDPTAAKRTVTQIDFAGRDLTADDAARAAALVDYFRDQGKITGAVDLDAALQQGWVSAHASN